MSGWEVIQNRQGGIGVSARLTKLGKITLTPQALDGIGSPQEVVLLHDAERRLLALRPASEGERGFKVCGDKGRRRVVSAERVAERLGLIGETRDLTCSFEDGVLVFDYLDKREREALEEERKADEWAGSDSSRQRNLRAKRRASGPPKPSTTSPTASGPRSAGSGPTPAKRLP